VFAGNSRAAVAATKAMLNERFGELLPAAMERETEHCVRLFDEEDARTALRQFAERRAAR
jgi:enoyl-CoA hydratase/carnithine racemase